MIAGNGGDEIPIPAFESGIDLSPDPYERPIEDLPPQRFYPWHRPRKQYIRENQWVAMVHKLLEEGHVSDRLEYLGLPGSDLIDLELFRDECLQFSRTLRYIGFNRLSGDQDRLVLVRQQINEDVLARSENVHRGSRIVSDEIASLADSKSIARVEARDRSFDVVNIDLCGQPMANLSGAHSVYDALSGVFDMQSARTQPWVLLVNAAFDRHGASRIQLDAVRRLADALRVRLQECAEVGKEISLERLDFDLEACDDSQFCLAGVAGFVSWLWQIGRQHRPANLKLVSLMGYRLRRTAEAPEMYSLGIRVAPKQRSIKDGAGVLSPSQRDDGLLSGCIQLAQLLSRLDAARNVDAFLSQNEDMFAVCRDVTADLLARRGYDRKKYYDDPISRHFDDVTQDDVYSG